MTTSIETINHFSQRYNTVGDYHTEDNETWIKISDLGNERMELLIAVHELVEIMLCKEAGVTDNQIDEFDFAFTKDRAADDPSEPGDDPSAPYHTQHVLATKVEKFLAEELGVDWNEYEGKIASLMKEYKVKKS